MKSSGEQVRQIGEILASRGDEESIWRFLALVEAILEGSSMVRVNKIVTEELPKRMAEHGPPIRDESKAEEARHLLLRALASKFPGLETMPRISRIASAGTLESLLIGNVLQATDREAVEQAILAAANAQ